MSKKLIRFPDTKDAVRASVDDLRTLTGLNLLEVEGEICIEDDGSRHGSLVDSTISVGKFIPFNPGRYSEISDRYITSFHGDLDDADKVLSERGIKKIAVWEKYGFLEKLGQERIETFLCPKGDLKKRLVNKTLPLIKEWFDPKWVHLVSLSPESTQGIMTLYKISLLAKKYGETEAKKKVIEDRVLHSILPFSTNYLEYLYPLIVCPPVVVGIPWGRVTSFMYFFTAGFLVYPNVANIGFYDRLAPVSSELVDEEDGTLFGEYKLGLKGSRSYFTSIVSGINRLISYTLDPRVFIGPGNCVDSEKYIKVQSALRLMFLDLSSIQSTNDQYRKLRATFSFLDKISNLVSGIHGGQISDTFVFKSLLSENQESKFVRSARYLFSGDDALQRSMVSFVRKAFRGLQRKLKDAVKENGKYSYLDYVRSIRNTHHGTFLNKDQFDNLFYESDGTIPMEINWLPMIITWTILADPEQFFFGTEWNAAGRSDQSAP